MGTRQLVSSSVSDGCEVQGFRVVWVCKQQASMLLIDAVRVADRSRV
jgi:hypothetical protein